MPRLFRCALPRYEGRARDVIAAVKDNGADLVVHAGDLDYESSPRSWRRFVDETIVGAGMDFLAVKSSRSRQMAGMEFASSGAASKTGTPRRYACTVPSSASCRGSCGEDFVCDFPSAGLTLVLSHLSALRRQGNARMRPKSRSSTLPCESTTRWKICVWHMVQAEVQVSYKGDSTGWAAYETCRKHGAFIVTGHAHRCIRARERFERIRPKAMEPPR